MDEFEIISSYSLQQAIADGTLVEVFKNRWSELSDGIPIVVTASIADDLSFAAAREIWNEFVQWKQKVEPTLPEEERLFSTKMNGKDVWVIYDGSAYTILYPEDY